MTWVEVTDTAVKIGLGALIAGVFTYLSNWQTLKRDARKRYAERRRDLLEKVLNVLIGYEKIYRHQKAAFDWVVALPATDPNYPKAMSQFNDWDEKLRVAHEGFADASAILLMIGEPAAETSLEEYRDLAYQWHQDSRPPANAAQRQKLTELREKIITSRQSLMRRLNAVFRDE